MANFRNTVELENNLKTVEGNAYLSELLNRELKQNPLSSRVKTFSTASDSSFFVFSSLYVHYTDWNKTWNIELYGLPTAYLLRLSTKNNELPELVNSLIDAAHSIRKVILNNFSCKKVEFDTEGLYQLQFLYKIQEKLNNESSIKSCISSKNANLHLDSNITLSLSESTGLKSIRAVKQINGSMNIEIPYKSLKDDDIDSKVSELFNHYGLMQEINTLLLQSIFTGSEQDVADTFDKLVEIEWFKESFNVAPMPFKFSVEAIKVNPDANLNAISNLNVLENVSINTLDSPLPYFSNKETTNVLKTEQGLYYVKEDMRSLEFISLDDYYSKKSLNI